MADGVQIYLGNQTRELRFSLRAVTAAERMLNGEDIQTVVLTRLSTLNLFRIAAAGFSTPDKRVSPPQVEEWVSREPRKLVELERAVVMAVSLHLVEVGKLSADEARLLGEAQASAASASAGTSASGGADGSGSTPPSSST